MFYCENMPRKAFYQSHREQCIAEAEDWRQKNRDRVSTRRRQKGTDKGYYQRNKGHLLPTMMRYAKQRWRTQRTNLIIALGGACFLCEEDDIRLLELHHWNGKTTRGNKIRTEEEIKD